MMEEEEEDGKVNEKEKDDHSSAVFPQEPSQNWSETETEKDRQQSSDSTEGQNEKQDLLDFEEVCPGELSIFLSSSQEMVDTNSSKVMTPDEQAVEQKAECWDNMDTERHQQSPSVDEEPKSDESHADQILSPLASPVDLQISSGPSAKCSQCGSEDTVATQKTQPVSTKDSTIIQQRLTFQERLRRRLADQEAANKRLRLEKDAQLRDIAGQLLFLESRLRRDQERIAKLIQEKDRRIAEQDRYINALLRLNRKLAVWHHHGNASPEDLSGVLKRTSSSGKRPPKEKKERRRISWHNEVCVIHDSNRHWIKTKVTDGPSASRASSGKRELETLGREPEDSVHALGNNATGGRLGSSAKDLGDSENPGSDFKNSVWEAKNFEKQRSNSSQDFGGSSLWDPGKTGRNHQNSIRDTSGNKDHGNDSKTTENEVLELDPAALLDEMDRNGVSGPRGSGTGELAPNRNHDGLIAQSQQQNDPAHVPSSWKQKLGGTFVYNRVMSTNHRSVTKPKDVKYKKISRVKSRSLEELRGRLRRHLTNPHPHNYAHHLHHHHHHHQGYLVAEDEDEEPNMAHVLFEHATEENVL